MKCNLNRYLLLFFLIFTSQIVSCQDDVKINAFKVFNYRCNGGNDSITLPAHFVGPKYFNYEEGSIVYFVSPDTVSIRLLCGGDAILEFNNPYNVVDKIMNGGKEISIRYYDKINNKYARKDYISNSEITYEGVTEDKKNEYNMLFDIFTEDRRKNNFYLNTK